MKRIINGKKYDTEFERLIHIADCFNIRAMAARYIGEDTPISYLEQCNVYRSPLTDDNGNEIDNLTTMNVDFDYYEKALDFPTMKDACSALHVLCDVLDSSLESVHITQWPNGLVNEQLANC